MNAPIKTGAALNRGSSKQDYGTSRIFLDAAELRFGKLDLDLAATTENRVAPLHLGPGSDINEDALAQDWRELPDGERIARHSVWWCNPPFADVGPWAHRCSQVADRDGWTLLLVPASVGAQWYATHVHGKALVLFLAPRIKFAGCSDPYPRDLLLAAYGYGATGFECWDWRGAR
jgi:hypothetical protein